MADQELVLHLDEQTQARIGTIAACWGLAPEEVIRLLVEQAIDQGVDRMLFEEEEG
jgi:antitoxin component of RelBE/YafQ-DinJ toxin-antitoxin module